MFVFILSRYPEGAVTTYAHRISLGLLGAITTGIAWFDFGLVLFDLIKRLIPEGEKGARTGARVDQRGHSLTAK